MIQSNEPSIGNAQTEYSELGKKDYGAKLRNNKITNMNEIRKIADSLDLNSNQRRELLIPLILKELKNKK